MPALTHEGTGRKVTVAADLVGFYTERGWEEVQDGRKSGEGAASTRKSPKRGAEAEG